MFFESYYLAKILFKLRIPSFNKCHLDKTANVDAGCVLAKTTMGRYSYAGADTHITDTVIGNFCSIGSNCAIGGGIHPIDAVSTSPVFLKGKNFLRTNFGQMPYEPSKTVEIGNDVWIGQGVYIKSGVKIGTGCIIGSHAVVTSDIEPYTIVAGVPAKILRKRFDSATIEKLMKMEWWNWDDGALKKYGPYFSTPEALFEKLNEEMK